MLFFRGYLHVFLAWKPFNAWLTWAHQHEVVIAAFVVLVAGPELVLGAPSGFSGPSRVMGQQEPLGGVVSHRAYHGLQWMIWPGKNKTTRSAGPNGGIRLSFKMGGANNPNLLRVRCELGYQYSLDAECRFEFPGYGVDCQPNGYSLEIPLGFYPVDLRKRPASQNRRFDDVEETPARWVWDTPELRKFNLERGNLTLILRVVEFEVE